MDKFQYQAASLQSGPISLLTSLQMTQTIIAPKNQRIPVRASARRSCMKQIGPHDPQTRHIGMAYRHTDGQDTAYDYAFMDSACDTCGIGGQAWVIDTMTGRKVQIAGYDTTNTVQNNVPIGTGITAVDLPTGETILLRVHEATILNDDAHSLFSTLQLREHGIEIDDRLRRHGGASCMQVEDYVIPFTMVAGILLSRSGNQRIMNYIHVIWLTSHHKIPGTLHN